MVRVVTIAREFGSGGGTIAARLAARLGWKLLDRALIDDIVSRAGVNREVAEQYDERVDSAFRRMLRTLWEGGFEGAASSTAASRVRMFDGREMAKMTHEVIHRAAELGGCVIVGRGGQCVLQTRRDTLHFFVYGPMADRAKRVRNRIPGETNPEDLIVRKDRERAQYIRQHFDQDWCDRHLYHGMMSSCMGEDLVVACIACAIDWSNR